LAFWRTNNHGDTLNTIIFKLLQKGVGRRLLQQSNSYRRYQNRTFFCGFL